MNPLRPRGFRPQQPNLEPFGLIAWLEETRIVLPLKAVDVAFSVNGDLAEVSLDQIFHQTANRPLDVLYTFPLPGGAAVFRCELIVNDRVVAARVEEQARAREIARQMKEAGHRTALVEMERDNLFTLSLGNVQPDDLVVVRFAWFEVLDHAQNTKSLAIPFTPGVRYIPGKRLLRSNHGRGTEDDTDQVPDASRISPPRIDELHPDAALISISGTLDERFVEAGSVSSATHPLLVRQQEKVVLVTLPLEGHVPDRDFVVRWKERAVEGLDMKSVSCVDDDAQFAVVRLDAPADAPVADQKPRDYYFLVDRSGSMQGAKWFCTARALHGFVGELGEQDRVWVTLFESSFQDYAEAPLPVGELKRDPAFAALEKLGVAGGTELLPALKHVLAKIPVHSVDHEPVVIIITDGQVGNESGILDLLRTHCDVPIHTFGIDTAVNDAFLKQLAAQHRGACVLMTPNDDIQGAVSRLGNRLRRPVLTDVVVSAEWEATTARLPDVHAGEHILVALKGPKQATSLELIGKLADQSVHTFHFELQPASISSPRLVWARQAIDRCLAEHREKEAVQLAIRHNLICRGATFIAYDLKEKVAVASEEIYQPSARPAIAGAAPVAAAPVRAATTMCRLAEAAPEGIPTKVKLNATTGSLSKVISKTRALMGFLGERPSADDEVLPHLEEIRARYLTGAAPSNLRNQILIDAWGKKAVSAFLFQSETGELIREILCQWATHDAAQRLPLLEALLKDISGANPYTSMKTFIKLHIDDRQLAKTLNWLTDTAAKAAS